MLRRLSASVLAAALLAAAAPWPALADPTCEQIDRVTHECKIRVDDGGGGGGSGGGNGGGNGGGGGGSSGGGPEKCMWAGREIPCQDGDSYWSAALLCYVGPPLGPPIPPTSPLWEGHYPDGGLFGCYNGWIAGSSYYVFWAPSPPVGPPPPDPRVLAQQAVAVMDLHAVDIGIVPEDAPGRVGVVGMPVWMWAASPGPSTMGPITRSASAGGYTVTATAKVDRVVWSMGDGGKVTCRGAGAPYEDRFGLRESPSCGYRYDRPGRYAVSAQSFWTVSWRGIGQSGTIPLDLTSSTAITVGEVQVLNR